MKGHDRTQQDITEGSGSEGKTSQDVMKHSVDRSIDDSKEM